MHRSLFPFFIATFGVGLAHPSLEQRGPAACPYAARGVQQRSACPYANSVKEAPRSERSLRRAEGKDGVFFMNRIAPGTAELYVANADGSNEQKLLGNNSAFDYHAAFSPDGKWITFTSERNGDGNSVSYNFLESIDRKQIRSRFYYSEEHLSLKAT